MLTGAENWHRPTYVRPQRDSTMPGAATQPARRWTDEGYTGARVIHFADAATRTTVRNRRSSDAARGSRSPLFTPAPSSSGPNPTTNPTTSSAADRALRAQLLGQLAAAQSQASALVAVREVEDQTNLSDGRSVARAQVRRGLQKASTPTGGVRRSRADDLRRAALRLVTGR